MATRYWDDRNEVDQPVTWASANDAMASTVNNNTLTLMRLVRSTERIRSMVGALEEYLNDGALPDGCFGPSHRALERTA